MLSVTFLRQSCIRYIYMCLRVIHLKVYEKSEILSEAPSVRSSVYQVMKSQETQHRRREIKIVFHV